MSRQDQRNNPELLAAVRWDLACQLAANTDALAHLRAADAALDKTRTIVGTANESQWDFRRRSEVFAAAREVERNVRFLAGASDCYVENMAAMLTPEQANRLLAAHRDALASVASS